MPQNKFTQLSFTISQKIKFLILNQSYFKFAYDCEK